jgi:hypothetical protein
MGAGKQEFPGLKASIAGSKPQVLRLRLSR